MSKNTIFIFITIFFLTLCLVITTFWIQTPNQEQKIHHQAFLCSTLQREKSNQDPVALLNTLQFLFNNSTPTYAYKKPKFYRKYAQSLIQNYLKLPIEKQLIAQKDSEQCLSIIQSF